MAAESTPGKAGDPRPSPRVLAGIKRRALPTQSPVVSEQDVIVPDRLLAAREEAKRRLIHLVRRRRTAATYDSFSGLGETGTSTNLRVALQTGHAIKFLYDGGVSKSDEIDEDSRYKYWLAWKTMSAIGAGIITDRERAKGGVVLGSRVITKEIGKYFDSRRGIHLEGIVVDRNNKITKGLVYLWEPTETEIARQLRSLRNFIDLLGPDMFVEGVALGVVTTSEVTLSEITGVKHIKVPLTREEIFSVRDYVLNDYVPTPDKPTLAKIREERA